MLYARPIVFAAILAATAARFSVMAVPVHSPSSASTATVATPQVHSVPRPSGTSGSVDVILRPRGMGFSKISSWTDSLKTGLSKDSTNLSVSPPSDSFTPNLNSVFAQPQSDTTNTNLGNGSNGLLLPDHLQLPDDIAGQLSSQAKEGCDLAYHTYKDYLVKRGKSRENPTVEDYNAAIKPEIEREYPPTPTGIAYDKVEEDPVKKIHEAYCDAYDKVVVTLGTSFTPTQYGIYVAQRLLEQQQKDPGKPLSYAVYLNMWHWYLQSLRSVVQQ
ncbi:hypothetical protein F5880DRAFT_1542598 [Lentinula raphanica]|nr:hypothetical protein F5880DRAFT_1542598 [Lentinula raphanica]